LRVFFLENNSEKMPASLENGPSGVARFRLPASLDRRIRQNLRPGETFSDVVRGLLESWATRRETAAAKKAVKK
jgi:hypothetical protein